MKKKGSLPPPTRKSARMSTRSMGTRSSGSGSSTPKKEKVEEKEKPKISKTYKAKKMVKVEKSEKILKKEKEKQPAKKKEVKTETETIEIGEQTVVVEIEPLPELHEFYEMIRDKCVLSERWIVYEPRDDISSAMQAILVMELDVTVEGDLRVKRCVKIYEDRSFRVMIDNVEMTHLFDLNKQIVTTQDVDKLLYTVLMKKVCQGLRTYDPLDPMFVKAAYPVRQRGKLWYAKDCTVIVQKVFMGNSCSACQRIRNQMKRRFQTESRRKMHSKPAIKLVKSTFGKALYSCLNDLSGKGAIPPSQYPRENMILDDKLGVYLNKDLQERIFIASTMPPPPPILTKSRGGNNRKRRKSSAKGGPQYSTQNFASHYQPMHQHATITSSTGQTIPVQEFVTEDGQVCYVSLDGNGGAIDPMQWGQMVIEKFEQPEMDEMMHLGDQGNIIIQNIQGEEFQLAEGQEYELIGEAQPAVDPIEIMPADQQQIQIIEVDDATMEQIGLHGSMDNMQIAHVDPNDPNISQLLRAFQSQGIPM